MAPTDPIVKNGVTWKTCGCCIEGRDRPQPVQIPAQGRAVSTAPPLIPLYREQHEAFV